MNVAQVKDEIRSINQNDKIDIHRWLDAELAGDLARSDRGGQVESVRKSNGFGS